MKDHRYLPRGVHGRHGLGGLPVPSEFANGADRSDRPLRRTATPCGAKLDGDVPGIDQLRGVPDEGWASCRRPSYWVRRIDGPPRKGVPEGSAVSTAVTKWGQMTTKSNHAGTMRKLTRAATLFLLVLATTSGVAGLDVMAASPALAAPNDPGSGSVPGSGSPSPSDRKIGAPGADGAAGAFSRRARRPHRGHGD